MRLSSFGFRSKSAALGALFALVLCLAVAWNVAANEAVTFTLVNGTNVTMVEFYASPPSSDDWEEDILGNDVLAPGEAVDITIDDGRDDCLYDFLAVFKDGDEVEHLEVSVCDGEEYVYE